MMKCGLNKKDIERFVFAFYCIGVLLQNILATKNIDLFIFPITTGVLISPIVFIMQDVYTEIYGFKKSKNMIIFAYIMNILMIVSTYIAIKIPPAQNYVNQQSFETIFASVPRIAFASFVAYMTGSLINSKIMDLQRGSKGLFERAMKGTIIGQLVDNFLFGVIAFVGVMSFKDIFMLAFGATILEVIYEIALYPVTKKIIKCIE